MRGGTVKVGRVLHWMVFFGVFCWNMMGTFDGSFCFNFSNFRQSIHIYPVDGGTCWELGFYINIPQPHESILKPEWGKVRHLSSCVALSRVSFLLYFALAWPIFFCFACWLILPRSHFRIKFTKSDGWENYTHIQTDPWVFVYSFFRYKIYHLFQKIQNDSRYYIVLDEMPDIPHIHPIPKKTVSLAAERWGFPSRSGPNIWRVWSKWPNGAWDIYQSVTFPGEQWRWWIRWGMML